jgi:hypothetical protein
MYISDKTHRLKDNATTTKPKGKGPKTIKINKKKSEDAFKLLQNESSTKKQMETNQTPSNKKSKKSRNIKPVSRKKSVKT